jgi:cytoplasmic iron level regulating protein YaaA (DUF328/UPF0246 family)
MKILLAPAETKLSHGDGRPFCKENFNLSSLFDIRVEIIEEYEQLLENSNKEELSNWFGLKNINDVKKYSKSLKNKPTMKAIQRYTGVAFEALNYNTLTRGQQQYIDNNVLIFSNLFGVVEAKDLIPDYKYKQGAKLKKIDVEKFYKKHLKNTLDTYLGDEIVDLRARYYDKFYKTIAPTIAFKFLINGKIVSHWAKYYRGVIVKEIAQQNIQNFTEFMNIQIHGLHLIEIQERKNIKIFIMEIKN